MQASSGASSEANPVLVETTRGNWVENRHRGAFCVVDAAGSALVEAGDTGAAIFPRSAIKAFQALAMFRSGAVDRFGLDDEMIALACASHHGEGEHVEGLERFLAQIGASEDDLECGAHPPTDSKVRNAMRERGEPPRAIHNNCSGKHTGMLADALALGVAKSDYVRPDHPVQVLVRDVVEQVIAEPLSEHRCGTDGCSIPTWAAPLGAFARGFARMATGEGLPDDLAAASSRILHAATGHPHLIRGSGSFDTEAMQAFGGRLMLKVGAEGVFCGALLDRGLGFALKCDDGNMKVAEIMMAALLLRVADPDEEQAEFLRGRAAAPIRNWRKIETGQTRPTDAFEGLSF